MPARFLSEGGPVDGPDQARAMVRRAYRQREDQLGSAVMRILEWKVLLTVIDICWREQLEALSFLARHAGELYGVEVALTRYQIDADHLGQELRRRVRHVSLRYLFELIVEPPPKNAP